MKIKIDKNTLIILAALLIVLVLAVVILVKQGYKLPLLPSTENQFETEIQKLETQSSSNEVGDIEKDLNSTDFKDLDKELEDIEKELDLSL